MAKHTPTPKLVMGHIEVVGPDGEGAIPYDEAVIHLEGDEDSEIEIRCPGALRLAPLIVKAVNSHDALLCVVRQMIEAVDSGNLQMSSPEIGEPENNIPIHPWHEELLHYARAALAAGVPADA